MMALCRNHHCLLFRRPSFWNGRRWFPHSNHRVLLSSSLSCDDDFRAICDLVAFDVDDAVFCGEINCPTWRRMRYRYCMKTAAHQHVSLNDESSYLLSKSLSNTWDIQTVFHPNGYSCADWDSRECCSSDHSLRNRTCMAVLSSAFSNALGVWTCAWNVSHSLARGTQSGVVAHKTEIEYINDEDYHHDWMTNNNDPSSCVVVSADDDWCRSVFVKSLKIEKCCWNVVNIDCKRCGAKWSVTNDTLQKQGWLSSPSKSWGNVNSIGTHTPYAHCCKPMSADLVHGALWLASHSWHWVSWDCDWLRLSRYRATKKLFVDIQIALEDPQIFS